MNNWSFWGDVDFEAIYKDEWCDIPILGANDQKARVDLSIVVKKLKMGLVQMSHEEFYGDVAGFFCESIIPCKYDEIRFQKTYGGFDVLINNNDKWGVITLLAAGTEKRCHIYSEEMFPCIYDKIEYKPGNPSYYYLYEGDIVLKYNISTKEVSM